MWQVHGCTAVPACRSQTMLISDLSDHVHHGKSQTKLSFESAVDPTWSARHWPVSPGHMVVSTSWSTIHLPLVITRTQNIGGRAPETEPISHNVCAILIPTPLIGQPMTSLRASSALAFPTQITKQLKKQTRTNDSFIGWTDCLNMQLFSIKTTWQQNKLELSGDRHWGDNCRSFHNHDVSLASCQMKKKNDETIQQVTCPSPDLKPSDQRRPRTWLSRTVCGSDTPNHLSRRRYAQSTQGSHQSTLIAIRFR